MIDKKHISEYEQKKKLYDFEENETKLNSQCEKKIVNFIMTANPDLAAQNNNQTHVEFSTVQSNMTLEILNNKQIFLKLFKLELKAFVQIRSQRTLRRSTINFKDVPDKFYIYLRIF